MKHWRRCWSWKLLLGLVILGLCWDNGLCRKRAKPQRSTPTIPRAFNETFNSTSGGKNDVQQLFALQQPREEPSEYWRRFLTLFVSCSGEHMEAFQRFEIVCCAIWMADDWLCSACSVYDRWRVAWLIDSSFYYTSLLTTLMIFSDSN